VNKYSVDSAAGTSNVRQEENSESDDGSAKSTAIEQTKKDKSLKDSDFLQTLKEAHRVILMDKGRHGEEEKALTIKLSHFKITELDGLALLVHRKTQKHTLAEVECWQQGRGKQLVTLREVSLSKHLKKMRARDNQQKPAKLSSKAREK